MTDAPNVRAILDQLDAALVRGGREAVELWSVLSALRGPDNGDETLKTEFTARIRALAFPRWAAAGGQEPETKKWYTSRPLVEVNSTPLDDPALRQQLVDAWKANHYLQHAAWGFEALGVVPLSW